MYLTDCIFTFMQENERKPGLSTKILIITNFTSKLHNNFSQSFLPVLAWKNMVKNMEKFYLQLSSTSSILE